MEASSNSGVRPVKFVIYLPGLRAPGHWLARSLLSL